ncbi:hypothetical protein [Acidithiobacillus ferrooxidans]|uniref:Uncharacterized protein n=1 Tax=Acidithiobacillus ferrooxidans TaxID=920 RepID=A0A2W1K6S9_ACIFR|nr:hypothetical protein [Acidithiobacillus ferrooxidans]MBU2816092.1 hypothetical protein [Acidithiobacillus ferrooxidans]MCR1344037.1 hypothetical protein [Acidithiobacillus ferrooxidans]PZD82413.1 hypothetical protein DN052_05190 [Acidithiobacillus ferrooxidans]QLK41313.1 hypothetical protein FE661_03375 [Acidithiobacillus ferrooxidans]QZT53255.1 hypothetical protein K7B00_03375 [Acidithiobacillus ferrooxidans]
MIERATDLPMGRRPRNTDSLPAEAVFPLTERGMKNLQDMLQVKDAPLSKRDVHDVVSRILLPIIFDDLGFLGMDDPDIRIVASWMPESDPEVNDDADSMPAVTQGRIQILPFSLAFATICRTFGASTTSHRRFKDAFEGERIRIVLDADRNDTQMYLSDDLLDALETGWKAWMRGQ